MTHASAEGQAMRMLYPQRYPRQFVYVRRNEWSGHSKSYLLVSLIEPGPDKFNGSVNEPSFSVSNISEDTQQFNHEFGDAYSSCWYTRGDYAVSGTF